MMPRDTVLQGFVLSLFAICILKSQICTSCLWSCPTLNSAWINSYNTWVCYVWQTGVFMPVLGNKSLVLAEWVTSYITDHENYAAPALQGEVCLRKSCLPAFTALLANLSCISIGVLRSQAALAKALCESHLWYFRYINLVHKIIDVR